MWGDDEKIRVTEITKNPEVKISRRRTKEALERCGKIKGLT